MHAIWIVTCGEGLGVWGQLVLPRSVSDGVDDVLRCKIDVGEGWLNVKIVSPVLLTENVSHFPRTRFVGDFSIHVFEWSDFCRAGSALFGIFVESRRVCFQVVYLFTLFSLFHCLLVLEVLVFQHWLYSVTLAIHCDVHSAYYYVSSSIAPFSFWIAFEVL